MLRKILSSLGKFCHFLKNSIIFWKVTWLGLDKIQPGLVLNLFFIFAKNPGWRSYIYKLGSYKTSRTEFGLQMRSRSYFYLFFILLLVVLYYYYLQVAKIVILSCFRSLCNSILVKNGTFTRFQLMCDRRTDRPMDGRMDGPTDGHTLLQRCENAS